MKSLMILGRQPALGLAELESLYGDSVLTPLRGGGALLDVEPTSVRLDFSRIGGSIKLAKVLAILNTTNWRDIENYLTKTIPDQLEYVPDGKLTLGISGYGVRAGTREISATALRLKKLIKSTGRSVRIVPNKTAALNSAQILHNQLTTPNGWELVVWRHGNETLLAQTVAEQDIEAYAARDQARPARDARVGMLPPKLAQQIINLASPSDGDTVLDAFCGTGVVLQEALLMGFGAYGTDIEQKMIEYSRENLVWLENLKGDSYDYTLETGDATLHEWGDFDVVAGETYLGKPFASTPALAAIESARRECDRIHTDFLRHIGRQIEPGTRLCLAVPAWRNRKGFIHLKTLDLLADLGYTRKKFVHVKDWELIYLREDQAVGRELVVLEKN